MSIICFSNPVKSNIGARSIDYIDGEDRVISAADYVQDGLVAMWDGIENAGWGVHDDTATKLFELVSGQTDYGVASTFTANTDNMEVSVENASVSTHSHFGAAVANAISSGYVYIEAIVFVDSLGGQIYGNKIQIVDGTFGWQYRTGVGGLSMFSSGWVSARDISTINADKVRLAIDLDSINSTITYHVGTQSSAAKSIKISSLPSIASIRHVGTKIFNIRSYNRPLTDEEINYNYSIDKIRFNLP